MKAVIAVAPDPDFRRCPRGGRCGSVPAVRRRRARWRSLSARPEKGYRSMHTYGRRGAVLAAAALALGAAAAPAGAAGRTTVPGSVPKWAQPGRDRGDAPGAKQVTVTVYLPLRDADGANALLARVSDPSSSSYGQYLTPDAFRARFAPSDADVAAVEGFLRGAGHDGHRRAGEQPLRRSQRARSPRPRRPSPPSVHRYAYTGSLLDAPSGDLSVPAALSDKVLAVAGLDQSGAFTRPQSDCRATRPKRRRRACGPARAPARRRPMRSSTRRRARRTSARRRRDAVPGGQRQEGPVRAVRLHAVAVPGRLRHRRL